MIFAFPTGDRLFAVFAGWPTEEFPALRADPAGSLARARWGSSPPLAARLESGRRGAPLWRGRPAQLPPPALRARLGPGGGRRLATRTPSWPSASATPSETPSCWLRPAEGLSGERPLEAALAGYARRRDEATLPEYRENLRRARLGAPAA